MSYTNETTHYGIPLPLGSDLTTPMDYNTAMQAVDTDLFASKTDSASALQKANQLQQDLSTTNDNVTAVTGRVTTLEGTATTQGQAIIQNAQDIDDVRADALDMIEAVDEGTAQIATVAVTEGNYFRYNDVLYIATANIAIGDTIVPNTNCTATNVGTELIGLKTELHTDVTNISESITNISSSITALSNNKMDKSAIVTTDTSMTIHPDTINPSVALTAHLSGDTYNPRLAIDYLGADSTDTDNLSIYFDGTNFVLNGTKAGVTKTATIPAT